MGRIRTIKPELFKHEELFDLEKETGLPIRVAFMGLFTCCDRDGRFKWRPRTLKLDVLPHDELDFSRVLDALWSRGFIVKYAIAGEDYGLIPTFPKHQVINNREGASELPEPTEESLISSTCTRDRRVDDMFPTPTQGKGKERKGKEGEGKEILVDDDDRGSQIRTIFEYWQKVMRSPRSALDKKRQKLIADALKHYSPTDICIAIRGCSKSPFHMGENDRGRKYNGLHLILRSAEYIDQFIEIDTQPAQRQPNGQERLEQQNARIAEEWARRMAEQHGEDENDEE